MSNVTYLLDVEDDGTFVVPEVIMERLGIKPGDVVEFSIEDGKLIVKKKLNAGEVEL